MNWFIFIIRLGGIHLGPQMIQASALCPILAQNLKIIFCLMRRAEITGLIVDVSLFVEDERTK